MKQHNTAQHSTTRTHGCAGASFRHSTSRKAIWSNKSACLDENVSADDDIVPQLPSPREHDAMANFEGVVDHTGSLNPAGPETCV